MAFDIARYARTAAPVQWTDLDLESSRSSPLSSAALRCLRYMCDIESYTVCYLRDLLVTPSHTDPDITTFLTMWGYEEYWHGEVLADVLQAHDIPTGNDHQREVRTRNGWRSRVSPIQQSILANAIGDDFVATHMAWGAINEWATFAGYHRLAELEGNTVLSELLNRIARQETRHIAFYASQAHERLATSPRARKITRFVLKNFWNPVGASVMPQGDTRHLLTYLMGGRDGHGHALRIDTHVDSLPGLGGLHLVERALAKRGIPG